MTVARDKFDQLDREWTDRDYDLLFILEEVSASPEYTEQPDRTLAAYMADIYDLLEVE